MLAEHLDRIGFDEMWFGEHHSGAMEMIAAPELMIAAAAQRTQVDPPRHRREVAAVPQSASCWPRRWRSSTT